MGLRAQLTIAFLLFAVLGLGAFGVALLSRFWGTALQVIAERQVVSAESRAHLIRDELTELEREVVRLSELADIDLADNDLEPEKRVLRIASKDSALLTITIAVLDGNGHVVWAEPSRPVAAPALADVVRASAADRKPHVVFEANRLAVVSAMKSGGGAMLGLVDTVHKRLFGEGLERQLGRNGWARLFASTGAIVASMGVPAFARMGGPPGQRWVDDREGRRWLLTVTDVGVLGLQLEVVQAADELDDALVGPFRSLAGILIIELAFAIVAGALLARSLGRLDVVQQELLESQRLAAMGRTAAAIAHELKNALNGVSVAVDLLSQGTAPAETLSDVRGQVQAEVGRLRGITDDLTFFAGPARLDRSPADVNDLVRRALVILEDRIRDEGIDVVLDLGGQGDPPALQAAVDAHRLVGVLVNLGGNAIDATAPSAFGDPVGAPASTRPRRMAVATRAVDGRVEIEVADNGAGIAPAARKRLFQPFFTTKRTGTGLGLAIARKVIEAHGGEIAVDDLPGGGASFRIELPRTDGAQRGVKT